MKLRSLAAVLLLGLVATPPADAGLEENLSSLAGDQATGYLGPLADGLSATMNAGAFRGASIPIAGLSVRLDLQASYISFSDDNRTYTAPAFGGYPSADVPTVIGDPAGATVDHGSVNGLSFNYPGGFDLANFGTPMPQLTIGNVLGTRAMIRFATADLGDSELGDFSLFGIGAQHTVSQYMPGLPVSVAVGAMYQTFSLGEDDLVDANMYALNVTASRVLGAALVKLEPFVGIGIDSFAMEANYDAGSESINIEFDRENQFRGTLGANVRMPVVNIHLEGYVAAENGINGSISFGI